MEFKKPEFIKISDSIWEIPQTFKKGMLVPARVYATEKLLKGMDLQVFDQLTNIAMLPGIEKYSFALGDAHSGYGFNIGAVAAFDVNNGGIISPGGIGFDINCSMRLVLTNLTLDMVKPHIKQIVDRLFQEIPAGVSSKSKTSLTVNEFKKLAEEGAQWAVKKGYGWEEDLARTELNGVATWADSSKISDTAILRGAGQVGTLGSGNHYLEIQYIKPNDIFDEKLAKKWGIFPNQVVIMWHCGSRGAGHQIASDYIELFLKESEKKYGIKVPDKELACAPFYSKEGQDYYKAMGCGVNMSFANKQVMLQKIRDVFSEVFKKDAEKLGIHQLFDIAHNRATLEKHEVDGKIKELLVHRKGSTASYPPGRPEIPDIYRKDGSPVIIGGSMETGSYLLVGENGATETFDSTAHGSGRVMSRTKARTLFNGKEISEKMLANGIYVRTKTWAGLAEEAGQAYKPIEDVVDSIELAGLSRRVCRFTPIGNIK